MSLPLPRSTSRSGTCLASKPVYHYANCSTDKGASDNVRNRRRMVPVQHRRTRRECVRFQRGSDRVRGRASRPTFLPRCLQRRLHMRRHWDFLAGTSQQFLGCCRIMRLERLTGLGLSLLAIYEMETSLVCRHTPFSTHPFIKSLVSVRIQRRSSVAVLTVRITTENSRDAASAFSSGCIGVRLCSPDSGRR